VPTAEHKSPSPARPDVAAQLLELVPGLELIACRALGNRDDARDAVQEVVARALAALESGRVIKETIAAFVHGIAMHVIADVHRARAKTVAGSSAIETLPADQASQLDLLIDGQEREALAAALSRLQEDDRHLLRRCFVDGEHIADIARDTGERADRIRKRKSRALQRLRELLRAAGHISRDHATRES
jgi:RNA polymerase sigma-70 factor (ECF subfamily)